MQVGGGPLCHPPFYLGDFYPLICFNSAIMIKLQNFGLRHGTQLLLQDTNLEIYPGQKIGITGPNGSGKTSFFGLLLGHHQVDAGNFSMPSQWVIAHVAQETPGLSTSAIDYVIQGDAELQKVEQELEKAIESDDGHRIAALHEKIANMDGYTAYARAAQLLHGLSFHASEINNSVASFSGGWRVRLNLARALMCRSDLLLLDEPTNHLDLDAVIWLEQWLQRYQGTLLMISHDRDFLNATIGHIIHFENKKMNLYKGNYDEFEDMRAMKLAQQQSAYEKQALAKAHMQAFVDRFKAKASKAKQAQSRMKALARMPQLSAAQTDSSFKFKFEEPKVNPTPLLALYEASVGYETKTVLSGANLTINPGMRLGLLAPNGAGKSTFIKFLAGELQAMKGECTPHPKIKIGYFAQHQVDHLDLAATPLLHFQRMDARASEQTIRVYLGGFAFSGEKALQTVEHFSGGEKARLALAMIVWQQPNLLLLDEPTNHLDIDMRAALSLALQEYSGALVLVSHDRHLLRTTTDELLLVAHGKITPFDGDLRDYEKWLQEFRRDMAKNPKPQTAVKATADQKVVLKEVKQLEAQIEKINLQLEKLEITLADPALYEEPKKAELKSVLAEQATLKQQQTTVETKWLLLCEELENG